MRHGLARFSRALWIVVASIAAAAGVGLGFAAWSTATPRLAVWSAILLLLSPALAVAGAPGPRDHATADLSDLSATSFERLRQAEIALAVVRGARAVVWMAISYLLVLWLCEWGGLVSVRSFLLPYTLICFLAATVYLPWLAGRERLLGAMSETLRAQLKAFKRSRDWPGSS
jgi:hypothetical protein